MAWQAAPIVEGWISPVFTDVYPIQFDPDHPNDVKPLDPKHPENVVNRQLDRVCFSFHVRRNKDTLLTRRGITFIAPNGDRYFEGPIDPRDGKAISNRNATPAGYEGPATICSYVPDDLDETQGYTIESWGRYEPQHHLWSIPYTYPLIVVPPLSEEPR